ncbi:hypothetical protein SNE25_08155 [Mucilaginibacter sabulilitoris]|uniref:Uncharacterized protein n=1 Tax=Mucilaginibacter sabulilitoris TaxID=1173583 RepID=A0ABZ0TUN4_9SPHI|nr:hypothetical protein [Mucilaginibacter sabulilitoris]WPU95494.1 hypothetical protein SNE25_08155 [Mucilaginibacter sabulilitoris]
MEDIKFKLSLILSMLPVFAYAHGEEALVPVFLQLLSFIVFAALMAVIKISGRQKLKLTGIYIGITILTWCIAGIIPYGDNMVGINFLIAVIPLAIVLILISKLKRNQH